METNITNSKTAEGNTVRRNSVSLDYINSDDAFEIDRGIQETIRGVRLSILAMGLGLAKIKAKGLFKTLGCKNITAYIERLANENQMNQSAIFVWLRIGEAYIKYQSELEQVGFTDSDGPYKLPCLESALSANEKQEVFKNLKTMSVREFSSYAKQGAGNSPFNENSDRWIITEKGNSFYIDGQLAIILNSKIDRRVNSYLKKVIRVACEAMEKEGVILPLFLPNRRAAKRFSPVAEQLKIKMGIG